MTDDKTLDKWKCLICGEEFELERARRPLFCDNPNCDNKKSFKALTGPWRFFAGTKFVPKFLADTIMEDFHFATMKDSDEIYYYEDGVYRPGGKAIIKEEAETQLDALTKTYYVNESVNYIRWATYTPREKFNNPPNLIVVENGLLDVDKYELKEHTPEELITTRLPVKYDPNADCPKIKKFLREVLHAENIPVIQEVVGYCLLKDYRFAKAVMLLGPGENGKSTLLNLIEALLGKKNIASPALQDLLYNRFAKAELYGKLANTHADIPAIKLVQTGAFKMLTGHDTIYMEQKHKDPFYGKNYAKLLYSANKLPVTKDITRAFFRRWIIIDFPNSFPEDDPRRDENLLEKLTTPEELSGFLNWALKGLKRLLKKGRFTRTKTRAEVEERWITETDSLLAFVRHEVEENPQSFVTVDDFYRAYQEYCSEMDMAVKEKMLVGRELPPIIPKIGRKKKKIDKTQQRVWVGIQIPRLDSIKRRGTGIQGKIT